LLIGDCNFEKHINDWIKKNQMENILDRLREIEANKKIRILYACETGSRAWGFPSPDSDYDIRFIYKHTMDWYLALNHQKDTVEIMEGDLDITGWDLRKCLKLLKKSNVPLIERFQSPVVYYASENFSAAFRQLIEAYYSPTASFFHHYSLACKFWEEIKDKREVKLKGYFYLLRSLLSCNWIVKDRSLLPMHIEGLMQKIGEKEREDIRKLIALKKTVGEGYSYSMSEGMQEMVMSLFEFVESNKNTLGVNDRDYGMLNEFLIKTLNESADN
jgi:uncharacterized protein